jgi:hypothetical protein
MRWSGLTPISPAPAMRKARRGASHCEIRSRVSPSRNFIFIVRLSHFTATLSASSAPAMKQ